jgi:ABC-type transport system involved in cytochrome bd biosynthesis fused ATPase/permease subunit
MKMSHCDFTYPGNTIPTLFDITVQVSLASRVACVGENGAGKSTMIKVRARHLWLTVDTTIICVIVHGSIVRVCL